MRNLCRRSADSLGQRTQRRETEHVPGSASARAISIAFGDGTTAPELDLEPNAGLNILVGQNDAGKTAIVDAIRQVLLTTSYEKHPLFEQDFHIHGSQRSATLWIEATLCELSKEQATVLEWLTLESDGRLFLWSFLHRLKFFPAQASKRAGWTCNSALAKRAPGQEIGYPVRELIRATYLRPLRDALKLSCAPGGNPGSLQILAAHNGLSLARRSTTSSKTRRHRAEEPGRIDGVRPAPSGRTQGHQGVQGRHQ